MQTKGEWLRARREGRWHEAKLETLEDPTIITNVEW
jgi:hypothetical protein